MRRTSRRRPRRLCSSRRKWCLKHGLLSSQIRNSRLRLAYGYALRAPLGKEHTMKAPKKGTQKSSKSTTTTGKKPKGFTDEERAAMMEHVQELKADTRRDRRVDKEDGENAVLAKIAALPQPDRALGERLHAIIKANAPALSPKTWYGMPAYAKDGNVVCFFQGGQKFKTRYATLGFSA